MRCAKNKYYVMWKGVGMKTFTNYFNCSFSDCESENLIIIYLDSTPHGRNVGNLIRV